MEDSDAVEAEMNRSIRWTEFQSVTTLLFKARCLRGRRNDTKCTMRMDALAPSIKSPGAATLRPVARPT